MLRRIGIEADVIDDDTLDCRHDPLTLPFSEVIVALVGAGVAVDGAEFHPPWPAQLLDGCQTVD